MIKKMAVITRKYYQLARSSPNLLISKKAESQRQITKNLKLINSEPFAQIDIYRAAALAKDWGNVIVPLIQKQLVVNTFELMYWKLRAYLQLQIPHKQLVEEFLLVLNDKAYFDSDLVLLSELYKYANNRNMNLKTYQALLPVMDSIIVENVNKIRIATFINLIVNIEKNLNEELCEHLTKFIEKNLNKFTNSNLIILWRIFNSKAYVLSNPNLVRRLQSYRIYHTFKEITAKSVHLGIGNQFMLSMIPHSIQAREKELLSKVERLSTWDMYTYFQKATSFLQQSNLKTTLHANQICNIASSIAVIKYPQAYVILLKQLNKCVTQQFPLEDLILVLYFAEKNSIFVDFQQHQTLKNIFLTKLGNKDQVAQLKKNDIIRLYVFLCQYSLVDQSLLKYISQYSHLISFEKTSLLIPLLKALCLTKDTLLKVPQAAKVILTTLKYSKEHQDIQLYNKALYLTRKYIDPEVEGVQRFSLRESTKSSYSFYQKQLKEIFNKIKDPKVNFNVQYKNFEFDLLIKNNKNQLYIDLHGKSHYYINKANRLISSSTAKMRMVKELGKKYEIIDQRMRIEILEIEIRRLITKYF